MWFYRHVIGHQLGIAVGGVGLVGHSGLAAVVRRMGGAWLITNMT